MTPESSQEREAAQEPREDEAATTATAAATETAIRQLAPTAQGYLVVETARGQRRLALGPSTALGGELPVLDWRAAPMAEVFFRHGPGELYEVSAGERTQEGRVLERWIVTREGLVGEERRRDRGGEAPMARPQPVAAAARDRRELVVLDPVQQAAVELASDQSLVLDGEAGVGKTLVALYRLAELARRRRERGKGFRALVLVPTEGLRRLVAMLAEKLGLLGAAESEDEVAEGESAGAAEREGAARAEAEGAERTEAEGVEGAEAKAAARAEAKGAARAKAAGPALRLEIEVFEEWMMKRARAGFPGLPRRASENAAAQVIALKRHPAVRAVLRDFEGWRPPRGVEQDEQLPRSRVRLLHLWGDQPRLEQIVEAAGGALPGRAVGVVVQHTRLQFERTTEQQHRHVDADRMVALDGRSLDAGTDRNDVHTFDVEDVPVLFELARRGALPLPELPSYHHVVLDEAQLRAPMELAMVGDALTPRGTATIAGDHRQASDESAWFDGWAAARAELRRPGWREVTLEVTYRSAPAISGFARGIVERGAPATTTTGTTTTTTSAAAAIASAAAAIASASAAMASAAAATASASTATASAAAATATASSAAASSGFVEPPADPAVWATRCEHALGQAAQLCWHLDALMVRDPWRQICVIGRTPDHARRLHAELRGLDATLVLDGDFRFEAGILVTTAAAVSGLEFDAVVIADLTPSFYPVQRELARALYVAATRARDWLWILTPDEWSPLVGAAA